VECLSCCACKVEDELAMEKQIGPVLESIIEQGRKSDYIYSADDDYKNDIKRHDDGDYDGDDVSVTSSVAGGGEGTGASIAGSLKSIGKATVAGSIAQQQSLVLGGDSLAWSSVQGDDFSILGGGSYTYSANGTRAGGRMRGAGGGAKGKHNNTQTRASTSASTTVNLNGSKNSKALDAASILKYSFIRSVKNIPRVSQEQFLLCLVRNPACLSLFREQLTRFRTLTEPYSLKGSVKYGDAMENRKDYGTIDGQNVQLGFGSKKKGK